MGSIQPAADHVRAATPDSANARIDREIKASIQHYRSAGPAAIMARIEQLDREWDIERTLELNASLAALTGVILAATVNKRWLILPGIVTSFLAQHAIQGWCPPLPLFRAMGVRTHKEIARERYALLELLK